MNINSTIYLMIIFIGLCACGKQQEIALTGNPVSYDHVGLHNQKNQNENTHALDAIEPYANGFIDFKLLKQTKISPGELPEFPSALKELNGKNITVSGFMTPYDSLKDMTFFLLMPIQTGCFFCEPPSLLDVVLIKQDVGENEVPPYVDGAITVTGTFDLWEEKSDEMVHEMFFFYIKNAEIEKYKE